MARNLIGALVREHTVDVVSRFSSRDGVGSPDRQRRLSALGKKLAARLIRQWKTTGDIPDAWLTYHVYHKAPDLLGPHICAEFGIPYFMAEVSHAPKQAGGKWDIGYRAAEAAIRTADGIIGLSSLDAACVIPLLADPSRYHRLAPFTKVAPLGDAAKHRSANRAALCEQFGLDTNKPILLAVGMMRDGDKLSSYRVLADALQRLTDRDWSLVIIGDGPARSGTERAFDVLPAGRVNFAGVVAPEELPAYYAAADIMVWPAINEAYGMAMLEAQSAGLPVVAGRTGGVPDIVRDGVTGLLCPVGDANAFSSGVAELLDAPDRRDRMRAAALDATATENDISVAAHRLREILQSAKRADAA